MEGDVRGKHDCPITRSNAEEVDDWMVDTFTVNLTTTNLRGVTLYPLEQIFMCAEKEKFLLMIKVEDDD